MYVEEVNPRRTQLIGKRANSGWKLINKDGSEDTESDVAKNWIGITETYIFKESNGVTELSIKIGTHEDYEKMFNDAWPEAMNLLKVLCEKTQ